MNNTGNRNTGNWNTGDWNTGNWNTGNWNAVDREAGHFNTVESDTIRVFNKEVKKRVWNEADKPSFLYFDLTIWIDSKCMTDEEKNSHPTYETTGGYLKDLDYKEAFQASYEKASEEEKQMLLNLPNFDADVFFDISGIDVGIDPKKKQIDEIKMQIKELQEKVKELES